MPSDITPAPHPSHLLPGHPDRLEAIRAYVVGTTLTNREIGARVGVSATTVSLLKRRHGWAGPPGRRQIRERGRPNGLELTEEIRACVTGTTLTQEEIAARLRVGTATIWRLTRQHGWERPAEGARAGEQRGRPYRPEVVEAVRALVERTTLTYREIAARTGVCSAMCCRWRGQRGWRRPEDAAVASHPGPSGTRAARAAARAERRRATRLRGGSEVSAFGRPKPPRALGRAGRPYRADAVEAVRVLVVGTALPYQTVALRTGVSIETIGRWRHRRGWIRPAEAAVWTAALPPERAGSGPRRRALARRAKVLAEGWLVAFEARRDPDGAARALDLVREAGRLAIRKPRGRRPHLEARA